MSDLPGKHCQTPKILCIDDDPDISRAIQLRLGLFDVKVVPAFHGMQGVAIALQEGPDLIITDWRMPMGEGEHVLQVLMSNPRTANIPIIVLSGQADKNIADRARQFGAVEFFRKPVHFNTLLEHLRRHIDLRERSPSDADSEPCGSTSRSCRCV